MKSVCAPRRPTRRIRVGSVPVGGGAPISVQSMTRAPAGDARAVLAEIRELAAWGCQIVRVAVPDRAAAAALRAVCRESPLPVVADIHFDHRLALMALDAGAAGLRINPGNIGSRPRIREIATEAEARGVPVRVGVNAGSLDRDLLAKHGGATAGAMVESAMRSVRLLEDMGVSQIKISVKASDVGRTITAYRLLSRRTRHPLHLGLTEAGTLLAGSVRSSTALAVLLIDGIGDTIRISLTERSIEEARAGIELLRALGLRPEASRVISCPTCARTTMDVIALAHQVESEYGRLCLAAPPGPRPVLAVMGCVVNGPGEAREADLALCCGRGRVAIYEAGRPVETVSAPRVVRRFIKRVEAWMAGRSSVRARGNGNAEASTHRASAQAQVP